MCRFALLEMQSLPTELLTACRTGRSHLQQVHRSVPKRCNDASWVCKRCLPAAAEQRLPHAQQRLGPPAAWTHLLQAGRVCQVALDHLCTGSLQLLCSRGFLVACEAPDLEAASMKQCLQARTASLHRCCHQLGNRCLMHHKTHIGNTSTLGSSGPNNQHSFDGCHVCA